MKKEIIEWLKAQDCIFEADGTVRTKNGDYVTLATLDSCSIANLIYKDGTYTYNSTFRWVKSVYAGFSQNSAIRFEVMEEIK